MATTALSDSPTGRLTKSTIRTVRVVASTEAPDYNNVDTMMRARTQCAFALLLSL